MKKVSATILLELYYARIFESNVDLEDADSETKWLAEMGWTPDEFEKLIAKDSFS